MQEKSQFFCYNNIFINKWGCMILCSDGLGMKIYIFVNPEHRAMRNPVFEFEYPHPSLVNLYQEDLISVSYVNNNSLGFPLFIRHL